MKDYMLKHLVGSVQKTVKVQLEGDAQASVDAIQKILNSKDKEISELHKAVKSIKEIPVNEIQALQKKLKHPEDPEEYLYSLEISALDARSKNLKALELAANPRGQATTKVVAGADAGTQEETKPDSEFDW